MSCFQNLPIQQEQISMQATGFCWQPPGVAQSSPSTTTDLQTTTPVPLKKTAALEGEVYGIASPLTPQTLPSTGTTSRSPGIWIWQP